MKTNTNEMNIQELFGTGGNDPFDYEYPKQQRRGEIDLSPYPRINRILKRVHAYEDTIDSKRALLITEAYKKYDLEAPITKAAHVFEYLLKNLPVEVYEDELIVGDLGCPPRHVPIFPEFSYDWIIDEMINFPFEEREQDHFNISEQTKKDLLGIYDFWKGRTVENNVMKMLTDEEKTGTMPDERPVFYPNLSMQSGIGHFSADFDRVFELGFIGIRKQIEEKLALLDVTTDEGIKKREFYHAVIIALNAVKIFFCRYAEVARNQVKGANEERAKELIQMAENLEWIAENPPRTFWEAIQLYHLIGNVCLIESNGHSISYGRFDQHLYPYYENDMKNGTITKAFAAELSENWCIKVHELLKIRDKGTCIFNAEAGIDGACVTVGGLDKNGKDITNDLSYILLEAHAHTYAPCPWLSIRWHDNTPWEFKVKCVNVIRIGTGQPKLFNDEANIINMLANGRTLDEARTYSVVGCVEPTATGKEYGNHDACYWSQGKVLELALNDGYTFDAKEGDERIGIPTGSLADFKSFDEVVDAYMKQQAYWINKAMTFLNICDIVHNRLKPLPWVSAIIDGCVESGKDVTEGGAVYNFLGPNMVGPATVTDSLCTIKQLIFEEKRITGAELLDALKKDWEGYESLYELINSDKVHHFGNDDPYADEIAHYVVNSFAEEFGKYTNARGGAVVAGCLCGGGNLGVGEDLAATPDGRKAYEPVSNSINPCYNIGGCHDYNGPTAVLKSVGSLDSPRLGNGTLLNMKFNPDVVAGDMGRDNLIRYMETLIKLRVHHVQFNLQDKETLIDAKEHPEEYNSLLVRVAAYSAYFTRLSSRLQDEVIRRHEFTRI